MKRRKERENSVRCTNEIFRYNSFIGVCVIASNVRLMYRLSVSSPMNRSPPPRRQRALQGGHNERRELQHDLHSKILKISIPASVTRKKCLYLFTFIRDTNRLKRLNVFAYVSTVENIRQIGQYHQVVNQM